MKTMKLSSILAVPPHREEMVAIITAELRGVDPSQVSTFEIAEVVPHADGFALELHNVSEIDRWIFDASEFIDIVKENMERLRPADQ